MTDLALPGSAALRGWGTSSSIAVYADRLVQNHWTESCHPSP
jgi:hypothetical protein